MCVSVSAADFSATITGTWEVIIENSLHHVLWYQNRVTAEAAFPSLMRDQVFEACIGKLMHGCDIRSLAGPMQIHGFTEEELLDEVTWRKSGKPGRPPKMKSSDSVGGNALIIPLMGTWDSIRLLNTADTPSLLDDVAAALEPNVSESMPLAMAGISFGSAGRMAFVKFGIYDIVFAERFSDIPGVLEGIVERKRPKFNDDIFATMEQWYRCPFALCCFDKAQSAVSNPLGFAFEPLYPEELVVYTLDGHDGYSPHPDIHVRMDHSIFVGSGLSAIKTGADIAYRDELPQHLRPYLLDNAMGVYLDSHYMNGDIVFRTEDVRAGYFNGRRLPPRFAPQRKKEDPPITRTDSYKNGRLSPIGPSS